MRLKSFVGRLWSSHNPTPSWSNIILAFRTINSNKDPSLTQIKQTCKAIPRVRRISFPGRRLRIMRDAHLPLAALVTLRLCLIIHGRDDYDCYDLHVISLCRGRWPAAQVLMASVLASSACDVSSCAEDRVDMEYDCYCSLSDIPGPSSVSALTQAPDIGLRTRRGPIRCQSPPPPPPPPTPGGGGGGGGGAILGDGRRRRAREWGPVVIEATARGGPIHPFPVIGCHS